MAQYRDLFRQYCIWRGPCAPSGSWAFRLCARVLLVIFLILQCIQSGANAFAAPAEQLVANTGMLPEKGRIAIRSGLAWLVEDTSIFAAAERALAEALLEQGLTVVDVLPSRLATFPANMDKIRNTPVPKRPGRSPRVMSLAEAGTRMKAMQLAREGKLPRTRFGRDKGTGTGVLLSALTNAEMARFALSQEREKPELRGCITIPGRIPEEVRSSDLQNVDYIMLMRFAMLWPGAGIPDEPTTQNSDSGLAVGWHLLELVCYDLSPVRTGGELRQIWKAYVQRVAFGAYLRGTLPAMARAAVAQTAE